MSIDQGSSRLTTSLIRRAAKSAPPTRKMLCPDRKSLIEAWMLAASPYESTDVARLELYEEVKAEAAYALRDHMQTCPHCHVTRSRSHLWSKIGSLLTALVKASKHFTNTRHTEDHASETTSLQEVRFRTHES